MAAPKQPHGDREHATWAASATERNWNCAGAITLTEVANLPDVETEAAAWGTACHQLSEKCLNGGKDAADFLDTVEKTKKHQFTVDDEMAECAQTYVDYVRAQIGETGRQHWIEQRFALDKLDPPFDSGGTADAVIYFPEQFLLEVIDLKGGRGVVVSVTENKQLRTYALGAMLKHAGLPVTHVKSTIVQPRAQHKDGIIRSETFHVTELMEWTADLLAAMRRSADARTAWTKITGAVTKDEWADKYLLAGDHCRFCDAAGMPCLALDKRAMAAAGAHFDDLDRVQIKNTPDSLDPEARARLLDAADTIQDYLNAVRAFAHRLAETGVETPGYVLVEKIGHRAWKETDADKLRAALFVGCDLTGDEIYAPRKVKTPAQIEKALGKKRAGLIANMVERPVRGTNLVRADKTSRKAATPAVNQHFSKIED